ncbi:MAG: hypothetical protein ABUK13_02695 [Gammaproteobacteria bacterium]
MKKLLLLLTLLFSFNVYAVDLGVIDPTIDGQKTLTLTCVKPLQYEDDTDIAIDEVVDIQWKASKDGGAYIDFGGVVTECKQVIDLTQVVDGDYIYKVIAWARGKQSALSSEFVSATVKRLPNPYTPTSLDATLS